MDIKRLWRRRKPEYREPIRRRVHDLQVVSARLIRAGFAGEYHSAFHGRGIEFSQVREYFPGDDIRTIDWNVTARTGVPHVKEFIEERDLTVLVALDTSGSMAFGSVDWRKIDIAAELVAAFAFSSVENSDRIGLVVFGPNVRKYIPPRRGRSHAQIVVRAAVDAAMRGCSGNADFQEMVTFTERIAVQRAIVIVLSDFLDADFDRPLRRLDRKHDTVAVSITDPREQGFPERGMVRLVDAETGESRLVDLRKSEVARRAALRSQQLEQRFSSGGIDHLGLSTVGSYDRDLLKFFQERSRRRR